uniref:Putative polya rna polymerase isoform x2 n=1 Tax=Lutzomyia longipalpis TaxID=7200 RepID=A0A1B0CAQ6_LUTLO
MADKTARYFVSERGSCKKLEDIIEKRRKEASRSVVVQVYSENSYPELHSYCSQFGQIKEAHHYAINQYGENLNYILLEFSEIESAQAAVQSSCFARDAQVLPVQSSFLYFGKGKPIKCTKDAKLATVNGSSVTSNEELHEWLQMASSIDDQLKILCSATKLNDLGTRMRFLAAQQIEKSLTGMFPYAKVLPFGSSINGFGKMGCDLDLILELDEANRPNYSSRLIFHSKELTDARYQIQKCMEKIGDVVELFLPGISNVRRILRARVPIVKYKHEFLDLEVDLSMTNTSGLYMSELLYLYGELDERVRPLVFAIRRWAHTVSLTNSVAGRWITNFSLTALVVFFLQQLKKPILPSINYLVSKASPADTRITIDGINCTFARDLHRIDFKITNEESLGALLFQFFEFYSDFDFANRALNLNEARKTLKPDFSPMYIVNPFETSLNVSKNVSLEELERFRMEVREAAWLLDSLVERTSVAPWGLLSLLLKGPATTPRKPMLDVRKLFEGMEVEEEHVEEVPTERLKKKPKETTVDRRERRR